MDRTSLTGRWSRAVATALMVATAMAGAGASAAAPEGGAPAPTSRPTAARPVSGARAPIGPATFRSVLAPGAGVEDVRLPRYALDREPVTNSQFLAFVRQRPEWRRDRIPKLYGDASYLSHWAGPTDPGAGAKPDQPVTRVSWFAARAYCEAQGARLPTWYEWEYAAAADEKQVDARQDPAWKERILAWYGQSSSGELPRIGRTPANVHGVRDLHGLVWEWVEDYSGLMVSADSRDQGDPDKLKFCGAGALSAADRDQYAVLMRIAMLSSLEAHYTTGNLGFRCATGGSR
jgi:formylglycine-generating enzyme required for sulfatase activity